METKQLRDKSPVDLDKTLIELLQQQFRLRMQKSTGQLGQTHLLGETRRDIARVRTILREKVGSGI